MVGFDWNRRVQRKARIRYFEGWFGADPMVYSEIWEDLQRTDIEEARIEVSSVVEFDLFLLAPILVKCYPTRDRLGTQFNHHPDTSDKWAWYYAKKIQALKKEAIVWPEEWSDPENKQQFLYSLDGTHCRCCEIKHPTSRRDRQLYSHKFNRAGINYEIAVHVYKSQIVWVNGPFKASKHDNTTFMEEGLYEKTKALPGRRRVVTDKAYGKGAHELVSKPNSFDPVPLKKFKSRLRARHESLNSRLKTFAILTDTFRQKGPDDRMEKH